MTSESAPGQGQALARGARAAEALGARGQIVKVPRDRRGEQYRVRGVARHKSLVYPADG